MAPFYFLGMVEHATYMALFFFFGPWGEEERQEVGMGVPPQEFP